MGYISKTVSKDETLIKQAKICKLSFLDRYIAAVLFIIAGVFAIVDMLLLKLDPIVVGDFELAMSSVALAGAGAVLLVLVVLLAVYRLVQKIGKVDLEACIPATVFTRLSLYGLAGVVLGLVGYLVAGSADLCDIICCAAGIVFGGVILLFAILRYKSIKLVVTDKRVFGRKNIWLTQSFDLPIDKADNVVIVFSFWGKMFNYATIIIKSVMGDYKIKYVKSSEEFKNLIIDFAIKSN